MPANKRDFLANSLREAIESRRLVGRLPSIRKLAEDWKVSPVTAQAVLRQLTVEGILVRDTGGYGYQVAGNDFVEEMAPFALGTLTLPVSGGHLSARIAARLRQEILEGAFEGGTLPTAKEIAARFACSAATVRKARSALERMGLLEPANGRRPQTVPTRSLGSMESRVHLAGNPELFRAHHGHTILFLRAVENHLQASGWNPLGYHLTHDPEVDAPPPDHQVAAWIYFSRQRGHWRSSVFEPRPHHPVVYISLLEERTRFLPARDNVLRLLPDNRHAGAQAALALLSRGHRKGVFLTHVPVSGPLWVRLRVEGAQSVFAPPGTPERYGLAVLEQSTQAVQAMRQIAGKAHGLMREFIELEPAYDLPIRNAFQSLYGLLNYAALAQVMRPLFENALKVRGATAWICANDALAAAAITFLREKGLRVPRDIAVVGFDGSELSLLLRFPSYDFELARMGHMTGRWLVDHGSVPLDAQGFLQIQGRFVWREER